MQNKPRFSGVSCRTRLQLDSLCRQRKPWFWQPDLTDPFETQFTIGSLTLPIHHAHSSQLSKVVTVVIPAHRHVPFGIDDFLADPSVFEVIVLANGSFSMNTNGRDGLRVIDSPWKGHGKTRQSAIQHVKTPYVLYSVDDAVPWGQCCISRLLQSFVNSQWDAVVARQVPWPSAPLYLHRRLVNWMPPSSEPKQFSQCDHVATMYRTERLIADPIPPAPIAEDLHWSLNKKIGLVGDAIFLHSHRPSVFSLWKRERELAKQRLLLNIGPHRHLAKIVQSAIVAGVKRDWASLVYEGTETMAQWSIQKSVSLRQPRA